MIYHQAMSRFINLWLMLSHPSISVLRLVGRMGKSVGSAQMLYVNNIRAYYNILKWLTEQEEPAEDELPEGEGPQETA